MYKRFYATLYVYVIRRTNCKQLAEDIVQQAFLKLLEKRVEMVAIENKKAYLLVLVRNDLIDYLRRENLQRQIMSDAMWRNQHVTMHDAYQEKEYRKILQAAIERLPVQRRKVYELSFELGMKSDEIANVLQLSKRTVKCQLQIARKEVRSSMRKVA